MTTSLKVSEALPEAPVNRLEWYFKDTTNPHLAYQDAVSRAVDTIRSLDTILSILCARGYPGDPNVLEGAHTIIAAFVADFEYVNDLYKQAKHS